MLHQINLPDSAIDLLHIAHTLERDVLKLVGDAHLPLTQAEVQAVLGSGVGAWLWERLHIRRGPNTGQLNDLFRALEQLASYLASKPGLAAALLQAYEHDIAFEQHLDDPSYQFDYADLAHDDTVLHDYVVVLLELFYTELLESGFGPPLLESGHEVDRRKYVHEFWELNETKNRLIVCPACDGKRPDAGEDGVRRASNDHFLSRARYPLLAIHPWNLVPICGECNERFKLKANPIDDGPGGLLNACHPYGRPARFEIEVSLVRLPTNLNQMKVLIRDRTNGVQGRAHRLIRAYKLDVRWYSRLVEVQQSVVNRVSDYGALRRRKPYGGPLGENDLRDDLWATACECHNQIGTQQNMILQESYLQFALADPAEFAELLNKYAST